MASIYPATITVYGGADTAHHHSFTPFDLHLS
jgi:hypothetical protein